MTENVTQQYRTLKAVVIGLGVLIVISLGIIATEVVNRMEKPVHDKPLPLPLSAQPGHPVYFGDVTVIIPENVQVEQIYISGGRLLLLLEDDMGKRRIHTVDAQTGVYLGTFHLTPRDKTGP